MTKEGVKDIREKVRRKYNLKEKDANSFVKTVASVLVNEVDRTYDRVLIDEALMMHSGMIGFISYLVKCRKLMIIGDVNQISYVDREHVYPLRFYHPSKFAIVSKWLRVSYRCPIDVVFSLSKLYEDVYSMSNIVKSMAVMSLTSHITYIQKDLKNTLYLVHFQSDKDKLLREGYGVGSGSKVLTIHEAQGLTFMNVICMRISAKPLPLYERIEYSIVAISRHTNSFVYYTDVSDTTSKLVELFNDEDESALQRWNIERKLRNMRAGMDFFEGEIIEGVNKHFYRYEKAL